MNNKLCLVFNIAPRYREEIYLKIDREYNCDWFFYKNKSDIKTMDISKLKNVYFYRLLGNPNKLYWQRGILSLLLKKEYQSFLMISETRSLSLWCFIIVAKLFFPRKKVYTWGHGWYGKESKLQKFLEGLRYKLIDGILVYGNYAKSLMVDYGIKDSKIFVVHNSLHYDQQKAIRNELSVNRIYRNHFKNDYPTIIFIGRLTKVKKLSMVLDALALLKNNGQHYNFVLIGDGEEKTNLEYKSKDLMLDNHVWFYGPCYDEKLNAELIYNADLCVSPGNVGLTAMHTMVFGCPVVTHNCFQWQMPEFEAIQPGKTGDFFEMDNVKSLSDCISQWFKEKANQREIVRNACYNEIDTQWNPYYQINVIKKLIRDE